MIDNKHISKMAAVLMILTVVGLFAFMICYEGSSSSSEMTMDYESTVFDRSDVIDINISMDEAQWRTFWKTHFPKNTTPAT